MINDKQILVNKLIALCKENKNGFTSDNKANLLNLKKGYAVSLTNNKEKDIKHLVNNVLRLSRQHKNFNYVFGGWFDNENKNYYLDVSLIIPYKQNAVKIGKAFNQKAIFNFSNYQSIALS